MAAVYVAVVPEGFLGAQGPVEVAARAEHYRGLMAEPTSAFWVLTDDDGRIVGNAGVTSRVTGVLSLGMALLPEARGRGGGRALIEAVVEHARATGAHKVDLEVWTDNARAIAVYAALGFEVEGVRRDHYRRKDGSLRSTMIMAWRIGY
jgi:[ribosomal protein S18]-alanine N-acetyltransferase